MSKRPLCTSPLCRSRGHHWDTCADEQCGGCQPRLAADSTNLCHVCRRKLGEDITALSDLHDELAQTLAYGQAGGEKIATKPGSKVPNPAAMDARIAIRRLLATWAQMTCEEQNITAPADSVSSIAAFLVKHLDWLAEHPAAGDCCDEFADMAARAHRVAYPNGTRTIEVGRCTHECEGAIKAILRRADSLMPSQIVCDVDDAHTWDSTQWLKLGRQLRAAA